MKIEIVIPSGVSPSLLTNIRGFELARFWETVENKNEFVRIHYEYVFHLPSILACLFGGVVGAICLRSIEILLLNL